MAIHIVVPGLLQGVTRPGTAGTEARYPNLGRVLARADQRAAPPSLEGVLFQLFGFMDPSPPASAAFCHIADLQVPPSTWIAHAWPVYLVADHDRLLLFDVALADTDDTELRAFLTTFNTHFATDGIGLVAASAGHLYLTSEGRHDIAFASLDQVTGRNIDRFMPKGPTQDFWCRVLNETQMLLHESPLNAAREANGMLPISGLWFSGGGNLPARVSPKLTSAYGDNCLLHGLCEYLGVDYRLEISDLRPGDPDGEAVCVLTDVQRAVINTDSSAWCDAVRNIDRLLAQLRSAHIQVHPCDGTAYSYARKNHWRIWRRSTPVVRRLLGYGGS